MRALPLKNFVLIFCIYIKQKWKLICSLNSLTHNVAKMLHYDWSNTKLRKESTNQIWLFLLVWEFLNRNRKHVKLWQFIQSWMYLEWIFRNNEWKKFFPILLLFPLETFWVSKLIMAKLNNENIGSFTSGDKFPVPDRLHDTFQQIKWLYL